MLFVRGKKIFILSAGRLWDEAKNVGALDFIAPKLDWDIYIAGDMKYSDNEPAPGRENRGREVRKNYSPVYLGRLCPGNLASWYAEAAIYALAARYEPFGLSVLEAALSGCALVLGDIASLREIWGDAAVFVPPDDKDAIAYAINSLIADSRRREFLADKARDRALKFTSQRMALAYLQVYQDLV